AGLPTTVACGRRSWMPGSSPGMTPKLEHQPFIRGIRLLVSPHEYAQTRLFRDAVPAADGFPYACRAAAARAGNPQTLGKRRPLRPVARGRQEPREIRSA